MREHLSGIYEYDFDFHSYIEKQLRMIDDLDERKYAKRLLLEGMEKMIRCMDERYEQLEQRIYHEIEISDNHYEVAMTVIKRQDYDPTNPTLFPVVEEDIDGSVPEMLEQDTKKSYVGTVYLEQSEKECRRFEGQRFYHGFAIVNGKECIARFRVARANRYREKMEQLYQLFQDNEVPWKTVNTGHLDKFYDIFMEVESLTEGNNDGTPERTEVHFGEFEPCVRREVVPVWNIETIKFNCTQFMVPCVDDVYFEHEFMLSGGDERDGYLIHFNEDILEIRHEMEKIIIKAKVETYENWSAFRIAQAEPVMSLGYDFPILSNHRRDTFLRRYAERTGVSLMTKTDLFRRIMELDIQDYIEISDYEIRDTIEEESFGEGMNWFVQDELFPMESRRILLLKFRAVSFGNYLNDAMIRFVVSQMQMEINEYRCVGVME
ncbi:hypothetical protein [Hungatella hathewayi]|uniref:Normocyte-binding protein n=1 Tax=Hungatella hathewayi WAL-18680 TaxID=742737 RepID=G5IMY6_9FIRM|nr:hypothetical protein [Hungatella hathewayi]EHI57169.1 hypothetical protein HMPREF9473_04864 [ [Hungatella hathewayi WAL-18680]